MRPVRFAETGEAFAVPNNVTELATAVELPFGHGDGVGSVVPHVNVMEANAVPLPVRWPLRVAVVDNTLVAAVVVDDGTPHGVADNAALSAPVSDAVTARITTEY